MSNRQRAFALIVLAVVAADWGGWALAARYLPNTIYNPAPAPISVMVLLVVGFICLMSIFQSRLGVVGCALCVGGAIGNIIGHLAFGPVADFIPELVRQGWQCNPADLAIWGGAVVLIVALFRYLREQHPRAGRAYDTSAEILARR